MKTVILGAGITGLSAALRLSEKGADVEIIEQEPQTGGLAASVKIGEYIFDYGPHGYHSDNPEILNEFRGLIGEEISIRNKDVRIKFRGKYYKYPLSPPDLLLNLDLPILMICLLDFVSTWIKNKMVPLPDRSAEDWLIKNFSRSIYDIFFGPYTQKVWGVHPAKLAASFSKHRIPFPNLWNVLGKLLIKGRLLRKEHRYAPFVTKIFYPKKGSGIVPINMETKLKERGVEIHLGSEVKGVEIKDKEVKVVFEKDKKGYTITGEKLISTIPITNLITILNPFPPKEVLLAAKALRFRSVVVVCLVVNKPKVFDAQSIYFTNKCFNRISDIKNYGGTETLPEGKTGLVAEITCDKGDRIWNATKDELTEDVVADLVDEEFLTAQDIEEAFVLKIEHGYPVYTKNYEERIEKIISYVKQIENLCTGGRQGLFRYIDMDIAMEAGFEMANHILSNKLKKDLPTVHFEEELFT